MQPAGVSLAVGGIGWPGFSGNVMCSVKAVGEERAAADSPELM